MSLVGINGVGLYCRLLGRGEIPLVLVHGSWDSHRSWGRVAPRLAESFRVLSYDRRGHSRSERPAGQGSVREDVADLAGLIEHFGLAPAWVVGNSFGTSIALRLAGERPELMRGLIGHEPPLFGLLAGRPEAAGLREPLRRGLESVARRIEAGDAAGAAEEFVDRVALGEGSWARLPAGTRRIFVENAPTFLDESRDPETIELDLPSLAGFGRPVLLTLGERSPPVYAPVVERLAAALRDVAVRTFPGAGHVPQATHPEAYVEAVTAFIRSRGG